MMKKREYQQEFDMFSRTSIKDGDYGNYLYGHNVAVENMGDIWDVYLHNAKAFLQGARTERLGTGKINNICRTLPKSVKVTRLDGEAYFQTNDIHWLKSWLSENRKALGIAKRRKLSESQVEEFKQRVRGKK